jgi:hypothetical protein
VFKGWPEPKAIDARDKSYPFRRTEAIEVISLGVEPVDLPSYSPRGIMRIGLIFAVVFAIIIGTILWKRGKPPVP